MLTKMFEIRDEGTFIPVLCIQLGSKTEAERWLLSSAGYGKTDEAHQSYILMSKIAGGSCETTYDPFKWNMGRTMLEAHLFIREHWDSLETGEVIDVRYILGETMRPADPERFSHGE